jgi:alpha-glucosidase
MGLLIDSRHHIPLGQVGAVRREERGIRLDVDGEQFRAEVLRPGVLRLKISKGGVFDETPTFAACFELPAPVPFDVVEGSECVILTTSELTLTITRVPFLLECRRADGSLVFRDKVQDGVSLGYQSLNDSFVVTRHCDPRDAFLGLGEKTGGLNRMGRDLVLWNADIWEGNVLKNARLHAIADRAKPDATDFDPYYVSIPFFYHLDGSDDGARMAGFFMDNGYRGHFEFSDRRVYKIQFTGGQYTEYVFAGPDMKSILEAYTWITGRMAPPPLWSLGYHQCRWHPYDDASLKKLAATFREKHLPCDVLWLDIPYMDGFRVFTWDRRRHPDPARTLADLRERDFRVITIIDPGVKCEPGYPVFEEGRAKNLFCKTEDGQIYIGKVWPGRTAFPDFVKPECRAWWGRLNAEHVTSGLAGIWNDMNEPATGGVDPFAMRFDRDGRNWPHERYHNQYALLMAMGTVEGLRQAMPDLRTFVLSRAGFAGFQRYCAHWMGDNCSSWDHLAMSLPMAMGLGISGQPFVGADAGGFMRHSHAELLARWMQQAAFSPFYRNHSCIDNVDQYPWSFGPGVEKICREALELRYRLLPYLYTAFMQASASGLPVQRPLILDWQADRNTWELDDQYLFGEHLLVAPVLAPGQFQRAVYLPQGSWRNWHTGEMHAGGQYVTVAAPMESIPVFARAGYVIPVLPQAPHSTLRYHPEQIDLHVTVPLEDGVFVSRLHEDDGLTFDVDRGRFYRTTFTLERRGCVLGLRSETEGQGYTGFARKQFRVVFHNLPPTARVRVGGHVRVPVDGALTVRTSEEPIRIDAEW